ncbi:MAG: ribonuclease T2 [Rhodobacteraceae bacterium HLUCCA12]|nr:MAG: ribonuclease T2 [Rhodobacteraceae bacterium HLUCCA12]
MRYRHKASCIRRLLPLALALILALPASAQHRAGDFDHYLLALSWMPAFCAIEGDARDDARCAPDTGLGWVVHGLWPQHAGGTWPEYCRGDARDPSRAQTAAQADLYGAAGAAWHQWNKHGRCTGLSAESYYRLARLALSRLTLPDVFARIENPLLLAPEVVEEAFIEANPGLNPDMMVTTCRDSAIVELRLCLTRALEPRSCDPEVLRRECSLNAARLEALR